MIYFIQGIARYLFIFYLLTIGISSNEFHMSLIYFQNDTMRILYMYNEQDPPHGSAKPGRLPDPASSFRPYRPMLLTQRASSQYEHFDHIRILELRNEDVELPGTDDTLIWCKMFKLEDMKHKHHLIRVSSTSMCNLVRGIHIHVPHYDTHLQFQLCQNPAEPLACSSAWILCMVSAMTVE